jgi:hypothetical protein
MWDAGGGIVQPLGITGDWQQQENYYDDGHIDAQISLVATRITIEWTAAVVPRNAMFSHPCRRCTSAHDIATEGQVHSTAVKKEQ